MAARGWGRGDGQSVLNGVRVPAGDGRNILEVNGGDGHTAL